MLPHNASALESQLMGSGATKVKVEGKSVKQFIQEQVKDAIAQIRKTKLTWQPGAAGEPRDPKFVVGKLRKDKTWIGPIGTGKYYIQNMRVFHSNGVEVRGMGTISDKPVKEMVPQRGGGFVEMTFPSDLDRVKEALVAYSRQAVALDPNICPVCFQVSEKDRVKMTAHMFTKHPKEFNAEMAAATKEAEEAEAEPAPPAEAEATEATVE